MGCSPMSLFLLESTCSSSYAVSSLSHTHTHLHSGFTLPVREVRYRSLTFTPKHTLTQTQHVRYLLSPTKQVIHQSVQAKDRGHTQQRVTTWRLFQYSQWYTVVHSLRNTTWILNLTQTHPALKRRAGTPHTHLPYLAHKRSFTPRA